MTSNPSRPRLVLASGSPRRRQLLEEIGIVFDVQPVDTDESPKPCESTDQMVLRLAQEKACATQSESTLVLAADTMVVLDDVPLGKPANDSEARDMLRRLAGRAHRVVTGVALLDVDKQELVSEIETSEVSIDAIDDQTIDWYVGTGEPIDKAGSYAIQGLGALFVDSVRGNYTNVVGLPLPLTQVLFRRLGYDLRDFRSSEQRPAAHIKGCT